MRCIIVPTHKMVEIASGVYQCPECAAGPSLYAAFSQLSVDDRNGEGILITWKPGTDEYARSGAFWEVDHKGHRIPGSFKTYLFDVLGPDEHDTACLPVISRTEHRCRLRRLSWPSPLGEKTYPKDEPTGKSSRARAPGGSKARSRGRRKTGGD